MKNIRVENPALLRRLRLLSNPYRLRIIELTSRRSLSVKALSSTLNLSYVKCWDYVRFLEREGLVEKVRRGKEMQVRSLVSISENALRF